MGLFSTKNSHNRRHDERFVKLFIPSDSEIAGKHETSTTNHSQGMTYQLPCYSLFKCWIWLQYQINETFSVAQALWKQEQTVSRLSQKQSPFTPYTSQFCMTTMRWRTSMNSFFLSLSLIAEMTRTSFPPSCVIPPPLPVTHYVPVTHA